MGARDIFLFYAITSAVGLVALFKFLPESKNKTLEEIEAELAGEEAEYDRLAVLHEGGRE